MSDKEQAGNELEKIARDCLGIETLQTRNSDSLDFHEVSVWAIKDVLQKAFDAGRQEQEPEDGLDAGPKA
jgi:hypothetical protein